MTDSELDILMDKLGHCRSFLPPEILSRTNMGLGAVLCHLSEAGAPVAAKDLAALTKVSTARMTILLKKLDSRGLILSEKDPQDRRKVLVSLSPEGMRLCGEIHEGSVKTLRALVDHFGYERFSTFLDTASEIRDWLTQACPMAKDAPAQDPDTPEGGEHDC